MNRLKMKEKQKGKYGICHKKNEKVYFVHHLHSHLLRIFSFNEECYMIYIIFHP